MAVSSSSSLDCNIRVLYFQNIFEVITSLSMLSKEIEQYGYEVKNSIDLRTEKLTSKIDIMIFVLNMILAYKTENDDVGNREMTMSSSSTPNP